MTTISLGIPHAAWKPERVKSMKRLLEALGLPPGVYGQGGCETEGLEGRAGILKVFTDREPNWSWSGKLWTWGAETEADFFLTLQDDALVAPRFIEIVRAMLAHLPRGAVLGLAAQHPSGPAIARAGHRWYATQSWAIGWGYGLWREDLVEFLAWRERQPFGRLLETNEDSLLNEWVRETGRSTRHPLPTIVQHDTSLETNYAGNEADDYRTSSFTWQDVEGEQFDCLADPGFWKPSGSGSVPLLPLPGPKVPPADARPLAELETRAGTIALAIPTTSDWVPERAESLDRLLAELELVEHETSGCLGAEALEEGMYASVDAARAGLRQLRILRERAPNAVWSEALWRWAAETNAEWVLQLQDDVRVAPNFWPALRAMLAALPPDADVMCLEVVHQAARALAEDGARWLTTADGLIGVGYVVRRSALREFLAWRATKLKPGALARGGLTEDTMLGVWCMVTGRRIWGPLPTIIDHDTTLESTYGNDEHANRRPLVRWDTPTTHRSAALGETAATWTLEELEKPGAWRGRVEHVGRFYPMSPEIAARWVDGVTLADIARWKADDGSAVLTGLKHRMLARAYKEPKFKVFLATPYRADGVRPEYAASVFQLQRLLGIDVHHEMTLDVRQEHDDLVRVRSRMLRLAYEMGATHMLLADGDNAWPPEVVAAMLRTGKDFVQCPYLGRDGRGYRIRPTEKDRRAGRTAPEDIQRDNTIEIEHTGLGLTLISRECMRRMLEHYDYTDREGRTDLGRIAAARSDIKALNAIVDELAGEVVRWRAGHMGLNVVDLDPVDQQLHPMTALFQLMTRDGVLMSEDASFATRWRDIGGKVWLYIGNGSPIAHYGSTCFQGRIEDLGFTRGKAAST
jgi:hypothetical protein